MREHEEIYSYQIFKCNVFGLGVQVASVLILRKKMRTKNY